MGVDAAARPGAVAQCLHPQRSVQLHPARRARAGAEGWVSTRARPRSRSQKKWLTERYHAPSDDVAQPVDKQAAGAFDVLVAKLLERIANRDEPPALEGFLVLQAVRGSKRSG